MVAGRMQSDGFTLLEVMIAVAVIAIAVVTLLGAQSQSVSLAGSARFDTMASLLAQWKTADLVLQEFEQLTDDAGNFGEDYPQFAWKLKVTELSESETGLPGTDGLLKALDITVSSEEDGNAAFTLRTIVCTSAVDGEAEQSEPPAKKKPEPAKEEIP